MMYGSGYGVGSMMGGYGWLGELLILLFVVALVVGVALLIVWLVRSTARDRGAAGALPGAPSTPAGHDEAVAIAKKRLASGEITSEQYDEILRTLGA